MPVEIVRSEIPNPPCFNCRSSLGVEQPVMLYIFDELHEVSESIKNGELNLAVCGRCDFRGWLWPGTLIIDRKRAFGVFVSLSEDLESGQQRLDELLEIAQTHLEDSASEKLKNSIIWVYDYAHIYELLCLEGDYLQFEIINDNAGRRRSLILDVNKRAEQFLRDGLALQGFALTQREATPQFVAALSSAAEKILGRDDLSERDVQALQYFREALNAQLDRFGDRDEELTNEFDVKPFEGVTEAELDQGLDVDFPPELKSTLAKLIANAQTEIKTANPENADAIEQVFLAALDRLFASDLAPEVNPEASLETLDKLLGQATSRAPDEIIHYGDETITVAEAVKLGAQGRLDLLCAAAGIATNASPSKSDQEFWSSLMLLVTQLELRSPGPVTGFLAFAMIAEFLSQVGRSVLAAGAYAAAVTAIVPRKKGYISIPTAMVRPYAIGWQRLGRLLEYLGKPERAALCAGFSARVFRHTGEMDGYLRSRLDALRFVDEVRDPQLVIDGARELLKEIRLLNEADSNTDANEKKKADEFGDVEVECLCLLACAQYAARPERPRILSVEMSFESKGKNEEVTTQPPETDSLPDEDTSEELTELPEESENEEEQERDETPLIFLQRVTIDNQQPFIMGASISKVDWYDTFQEAATLAAEYKMNSRWFNVWLQLLERSKAFQSPDLTLYLYHVMNAQAKDLGLKDVPQEFDDLLLLVVGSSLNAATTGEREHFFSSRELQPALDRWSEQLHDSKDSSKGSLAQRKWFGEVWAMEAGELFEATNRYTDAKHAYLRVVRFSEQRLQSATERRYIEYLTTLRVTGLYRTARASLKDFLANPDHDKLVECLNTIELYKARSALKDPYKPLEVEVDTSQNRSSATSLFESTKLADWVNVLPPSTGVMVFALLQETELNEGFWFSAFVVPHTGSIINPRLIKFDEIYQPYLAVTAALDHTRAAINGMSLAAAATEAERTGSALNEALESLGDALFPAEVVAHIEREQLTRIVIVPESYLFEVPFPALSVQSQNGRQRLFQLNEKSGGLALSAAPNLSCFRDVESGKRIPLMLRHSISQIIVTQPEWRPDLAPIFGVGKRIRAAIASSPLFQDVDILPSALDDESKTTRVADFLRMLRDSQIGVFFGHGEIDPKRGSYFVVNDGPVGEYEIAASARISSFLCQLFVACACSGVNSNSQHALSRRDLTGAHLAMLRGGVRFIVGNVEPLFPVVAIQMLEAFFGDLNNDVSFDQALRRVYVALAENPATANPVFWGHIVGFGNGIEPIAKGELHA